MGMFDYVNYSMDCPICGSKVDGFQSKDGPCCLTTLEYTKVSNFYAHCEKCETWIEFTRKPATSIEDFKMEVEDGKNK